MASRQKGKAFQKPLHSFKVSITKPHLHYFDIELLVKAKSDSTILCLPVWTPGSYLIRDYSGNIIKFSASHLDGKELSFKQITTSSWEIVSKKKSFKVNYTVYAFENSVRTNYLDTEFGFINSPSLFLYPKDRLNESCEIAFETNSFFQYIYSSLKRKDNKFFAKNFDELFDSPFQISNRESFFFDSGNCRHEVILESEIDPEIKTNLQNDLKRITSFETELMGENPNEYYLFIINFQEDGYGGLEHSRSSANLFDQYKISDPVEYKKLLGLLAHEYFHLWNVKRIRPKELGPFDYQNQNPTRELWISEGATSFYDNYILLKCGVFSEDEYLSEILVDIQKLEDSGGEEVMSLENSSFNAWTKFYKQHQSSHNTGISYYVKGAVLVLCMDIYLRVKSRNKFKFIDILKSLYSEFHKKKNQGFDRDDFFKTAKEVTGVDLSEEFLDYLTKPVRLPVYKYLEKMGIEKSESEKKVDLTFETNTKNGKEIITKIYEHKSSGKVDINLGDELIAIDNVRITKETLKEIKNKMQPGKQVTLILSRRDKIIERRIKLEAKYSVVKLKFASLPLEEALKIRENFFRVKS